MSGESLAKIIVEDLGLPTSYELDISNQVKNALQEYKKLRNSWNGAKVYPNSNLREDPANAPYKEKYCTIILDLEAEGVSYQDRFEWDIFSETNNPSEFSKVLVADLGLPPCFERLINFEISKQVGLLDSNSRSLTSKCTWRRSGPTRCTPPTLARRSIGASKTTRRSSWVNV